jgi:acyl-CoA synthetase (NDP forming)
VPVLAVVMTPMPNDAGAAADEPRVPVYATPEHAARALGHAARHAANRRRRAPEAVQPPEVDRDAGAAIVARALGTGPGWLSFEDTTALLGAYGLPLAGARVARSPHAAGRAAEMLGDVQVRLAPVSPIEATGMIHGLRTFPLLDGFRGAPRADVAALQDVVVRIGWLAANHAEIAELDLNPVIVSPDGAVAVDARVRVEPPARRPPYPAIGR